MTAVPYWNKDYNMLLHMSIHQTQHYFVCFALTDKNVEDSCRVSLSSSFQIWGHSWSLRLTMPFFYL